MPGTTASTAGHDRRHCGTRFRAPRGTLAGTVKQSIMYQLVANPYPTLEMKGFHLTLSLLAILLLLAACGKRQTSDAARVSGEIKGLGDDTLLVCGMDRLFGHIDTLVVRDGKFSDTLSVDTLTGLYLLFRDGTERPFFADRRDPIHISGSADRLTELRVTGTQTNDELTAFLEEVTGTPAPDLSAVQEKAGDFIRSHPASAVSAYLLEKYFFHQPRPDHKRIEELVAPLTGEVKDRPGMTALLDFLEDQKKVADGRPLPFIQVTDADGKKIGRSQFKDQYLLIHYWASWDAASRRANEDLRPLHEAQRKAKEPKLALLGISLDVDRQAWLDAVRHDHLDWKQGCDLRGWESDAVRRMAIDALPFNVLVNPKGRIVGINLTVEEVERELE